MALKTFKKKESIDKDVRDYRDEVGLSTRQLDWGLRLVRYRKTFVIFAIWFLTGAGIGTLGYSLYSFGHYLIVGRAEDQQVYQDLSATPLPAPNKSFDAQLSYPAPRILLNAGSRGDVVVPVTNPNPRSAAYFNYHFLVNGAAIGGRSDFILPGETKYLLALGQEIPAGSTDAQLVIENYSLKRVDAHAVPDWAAYRAQRMDFRISDARFVPGTSSGLSEKLSVGEMSFTIANASAYGYRNLRLIILLKSNGEVVAANDYVLENFRSGETRSPRLSWTGNVPPVNQVEVIPDLDILDSGIYLPYSLR